MEILSLEGLVQALEDAYARRPSMFMPTKLRQGCISYTSDHELTEEETDQLWLDTFGHT